MKLTFVMAGGAKGTGQNVAWAGMATEANRSVKNVESCMMTIRS